MLCIQWEKTLDLQFWNVIRTFTERNIFQLYLMHFENPFLVHILWNVSPLPIFHDIPSILVWLWQIPGDWLRDRIMCHRKHGQKKLIKWILKVFFNIVICSALFNVEQQLSWIYSLHVHMHTQQVTPLRLLNTISRTGWKILGVIGQWICLMFSISSQLYSHVQYFIQYNHLN